MLFKERPRRRPGAIPIAFHPQTGEELGGINLSIGSSPHLHLYAGHIGYSVHAAHRGHRYAARSVRLLMPVARQLHFEILWITRDPENISSRRTAELAGAQFVEIVSVPEDCIIPTKIQRAQTAAESRT